MGKQGPPTTTSPVFRRVDVGRHASSTRAIFFPIPAPSSLHTHFSSRVPPFASLRTSLHHALLFSTPFSYHTFLFSIVFFFSILLNSCLYISDLDRNSLSLRLRAPNTRLKDRNERSFYKLQVCWHHYLTTNGARRRILRRKAEHRTVSRQRDKRDSRRHDDRRQKPNRETRCTQQTTHERR